MPALNKFSISILCCKFQGVKINRATSLLYGLSYFQVV